MTVQRNNFVYLTFLSPSCKNLLALISIMSFLTLKIYAQEVHFRHLTSDDGLSQNFISCILQDQKGFMWFGTKDGLNRYDGYSFVVYQNDPFDSTTISENYITALYEDSRGYIWIGTLKGGLNCFQRETEIFIRINFRSHTQENNNLNEIKSITEDSRGNIWFATRGDGLFRLSIKNGNPLQSTYKQFINAAGNTGSISSNIITCLLIDSKENLWMSKESGLNQFDFSTEKFKHFDIQTRNPNAPESPYQNSVSSI